MPNDQSSNGVGSVGCSTETGDDGGLLALEAKLTDLVAELLAALRIPMISPGYSDLISPRIPR